MTEEIKEIEQYLKKCSNCFTCNNFLGEDENGGHCMLRNAYNYITNLQKEKEELQRKYLTINENNQNMQEEMARTWEKCDVYESRNEKAVEYIKKTNFIEKGYIKFMYELENILEGGDE